MLVLHDQKIIFLKARKVAGTSFELALSRFSGLGDIITPVTDKDEGLRQNLGFRGPQNYRHTVLQMLMRPRLSHFKHLVKGELPPRYFNHISAKATKRFIGDNIWNTYQKVSIVRDPFDYAVSSYFWANGDQRPDFETWCLDNPAIFGANNAQYLISNEPVVDLWVRYEHLEDDIKALEEKIPTLKGLYKTFTNIKAKGEFRPKKGSSAKEMFASAPNSVALINARSTYEIKRFGYSFT